jgi:hypothetical protein
MYVWWYESRAQTGWGMWGKERERKKPKQMQREICSRESNQSAWNKTHKARSSRALLHPTTASILAVAASAGRNRNFHPMRLVDIGVPDSVVGVADPVDLAVQRQHPNQIG